MAAQTSSLIPKATGRPFNRKTFAHLFAEIRDEAAKIMPRVKMPFDPEQSTIEFSKISVS